MKFHNFKTFNSFLIGQPRLLFVYFRLFKQTLHFSTNFCQKCRFKIWCRDHILQKMSLLPPNCFCFQAIQRYLSTTPYCWISLRSCYFIERNTKPLNIIWDRPAQIVGTFVNSLPINSVNCHFSACLNSKSQIHQPFFDWQT